MEVPLIKNGNIVNRKKPSKINNNSIILANTCPYDSIFQALALAYCDSKRYGEFLDDNQIFITIYSLIKTLVTSEFSKDFINKRIEILKNICQSEKLINETIMIRCERNLATSYEKIFKGLESIIEIYKCTHCEHEWQNKKK